MNILWEELTFGLPDTRQFLQVLIRLIAASVLGAVVGLQRESAGKPAGLRTMMLVALGSTVFILACSTRGMPLDGQSRVIQGIVTGIGFIGAGNILKLSQERDIQGLTTAAAIWTTAAIGVAVGLGCVGIAVMGTVFAMIILTVVFRLEQKLAEMGGGDSVENGEHEK